MQYPKGSVLLFVIYTNNYKDIETQLIKSFCTTYKARPDIGREYFEGDYTDMAKKITEISKNIDDEMSVEPLKLNELEPLKLNKVEPLKLNKVDPTICIMDFIDEHRDLFSNKTLKSKDVYNQLIEWTVKKDFTVYLTHAFMTNVLIKSYGVGHKVCRFADGVNQGVIFPDLKGGETVIPVVKKKCVKLNKQPASEEGTSEEGTSEEGTNITSKTYKCERCGYSTDDRSNFMKHLTRKNVCEPLLSEIDVKDLIKKATFKEEDPRKIHKCYTCDAKFTTVQARCRHSKQCKDRNKVDVIIDVV